MNDKRIAVINFSGNVGKTTIATHLLAPRFKGAKIISVESLNIDGAADGIDVERMRGAKFGDIQRELLMHDGSVLIDVGASNVEPFMKAMQQFHGSHADIDYFIVPTWKERKAQGDTINTIKALALLGVEAKRVLLVFNKLDLDENTEDEFPALYGFHQAEQLFTLNPGAVIYANEVFERIKGAGKMLPDVLADTTDYREQFRASKTNEEKELCIRMLQVKQLAGTAQDNLDAVFSALFPVTAKKRAVAA